MRIVEPFAYSRRCLASSRSSSASLVSQKLHALWDTAQGFVHVHSSFLVQLLTRRRAIFVVTSIRSIEVAPASASHNVGRAQY